MGSGASASGDAKIGGKETTIIEFGNDGQLVRHLSQKPWADVEQILLVFDPRTDPFHDTKTPDDWTDAVKKKVVTFLLMPSLTSSPECLLCAEIGLQCFTPDKVPLKDVRVVRVDDYLSLGHDILKAMIEKNKKVYPAEERDSMLKLIGFDPALSYKEEICGDDDEKPVEEKCEQVSRFHCNIYNFRAWCHWPVGGGLEESGIMEGWERMLSLLSDADNALPSLGPVPSDNSSDFKSPKPFHGSKSSPVGVVFSEASLAKYSEICKIPVVLCKDVKDLKDDDKYPILFMEPEDLCADPEKQQYKTTAIEFLSKYREAEQVSNFFSKTKHPMEHVGKSLCMQSIPFPRLHFFTMGTAMGQELQDHEILTPAVTVGSKASGIPAQKFNSQCPWSPFFLTGKDLKPLAPERLIAAADGFDGATVIQPANLIMKLLKGIQHKFGGNDGEVLVEEEDFEMDENGQNKWEMVFGEKYKDWNEMEFVEATSNCDDLRSEYQQYKSCAAPGDKKPL
eukprot:TRINITY_DN5389_c0_g1_i1.p1 TRINITY_DN5389_c0_g1~~TRINITY_DN5389_c0_g1_i1.p1  ORF type:complete len:508 (-),score=98.38 TRINITY_DN5389_c0_g1_i1:202-1725(-)